MSGSDRESLLNVREWSEGPPRCSGVVERPTKSPGMVKRQSWKSGKGWETLLEVCEGSGGFMKTWKGRVAHPKVRESSGYTTGSFGKSWEALPEVWQWSVNPATCLGVVWRPSRVSESGAR